MKEKKHLITFYKHQTNKKKTGKARSFVLLVFNSCQSFFGFMKNESQFRFHPDIKLKR